MREKILVFGFGRQGQKEIKALERAFDIIAIVDNDKSKSGSTYNGISILHTEEAEELLKKYRIIVTTQPSFYKAIKEQLEKTGLREGENFLHAHAFIPAWFYENKEEVDLYKLDLIITTICNLNCENCIEFLPYFKGKRESSFLEIQKNVDLVFSKVDYICQLNIMGGETFLHKELVRILEYLGEHYGEEVGYFCIITNGTVMPSDEVLDVIGKYNMGVSISDYALNSAYENKVNMLCEKFDQWKIEYMRNQHIEWYDLGFPKDKFLYDETTVCQHMKNCNTLCQALYDEKIWYCSVACCAYYGGIFPEGENDYLDLKMIDETDILSKKKLLDYCNGNVKNGYLQMCKYCGGLGVDNDNVVPTAKQYVKR